MQPDRFAPGGPTGRPDVPDLVVPDAVTPFHLADRPVRGRLVRLGPLADALLTRHAQPAAVTRLAGEALALAAGLATTLKYRGSFSIQIRGDGPVSMLLADCTEAGALRGYARAEPVAVAALPPEARSAAALLGRGSLAFTVDQGPDTERYQGVVALEGDSLAAMAEAYFARSEQMGCAIQLACARTEAGWRAGALVLERLPQEGGISHLPLAEVAESWRAARLLAATLTPEELLDDAIAPERLLYRLFHTEGVAAAPSRPLAYGCRCTRERLAGILESFSADDLDHMAVDGTIVMTCEFCNHDFRFPRQGLPGRTTH